jgi:hypothetical protein
MAAYYELRRGVGTFELKFRVDCNECSCSRGVVAVRIVELAVMAATGSRNESKDGSYKNAP